MKSNSLHQPEHACTANDKFVQRWATTKRPQPAQIAKVEIQYTRHGTVWDIDPATLRTAKKDGETIAQPMNWTYTGRPTRNTPPPRPSTRRERKKK